MYPRDKCYFCGENITYACETARCHVKHHYWVGADYISFNIENYFYKFYSTTDLPYKMIIADDNDGSKYYLPCHWEITLDNYKEQVERARNLQVLQ